MQKILRILNLLFNLCIDVCFIFAVLVVALYFIWGITPQTVVEKSAYFFSESWKIVSGQREQTQEVPVVTQKQVEEAKEHVNYR